MGLHVVYVPESGEAIDGESVGSAAGWSGFADWAASLADSYPEAAHLAENGDLEPPEALAELEHELEGMAHEDGDTDAKAVAARLLELLRSRPDDTAALIVTDGDAGDEEVEDDSLSKSFGAVTKAWQESDHPRGDDGRFISAGEIDAAKGDAKAAASLRSRVTDPEQRAKLEKHLGNGEASPEAETSPPPAGPQAEGPSSPNAHLPGYAEAEAAHDAKGGPAKFADLVAGLRAIGWDEGQVQGFVDAYRPQAQGAAAAEVPPGAAAVDKVRQFNEVYQRHLPAARKVADTMDGASALMRKHGESRINDAIHAEAMARANAELQGGLEVAANTPLTPPIASNGPPIPANSLPMGGETADVPPVANTSANARPEHMRGVREGSELHRQIESAMSSAELVQLSDGRWHIGPLSGMTAADAMRAHLQHNPKPTRDPRLQKRPDRSPVRSASVKRTSEQEADLRREVNAAAAEQQDSGRIGKQNHERTRDEFIKREGAMWGTPERAADAHRRIVEGSLAKGEHVPPEVLADYPDLRSAPKPGGSAPSPVRVLTDAEALGEPWESVGVHGSKGEAEKQARDFQGAVTRVGRKWHAMRRFEPKPGGATPAVAPTSAPASKPPVSVSDLADLGRSLPDWAGNAHDPGAPHVGHKVFISDLHERLAPGMSLDEFKAHLEQAHPHALSRIDMSELASDPDKLDASETRRGSHVVDVTRLR